MRANKWHGTRVHAPGARSRALRLLDRAHLNSCRVHNIARAHLSSHSAFLSITAFPARSPRVPRAMHGVTAQCTRQALPTA
eukprot:6712029-Prymnesium_polylepis.1